MRGEEPPSYLNGQAISGDRELFVVPAERLFSEQNSEQGMGSSLGEAENVTQYKNVNF